MAATSLDWWQGSGFLTGNNPSLDVDDPRRISSNVFQLYPVQNWQPLATGFFNIPASVDGAPPTAPQPYAAVDLTATPISETPIANVNPSDTCKANCTMGGCSDPTSAVYQQCVDAGCCQPRPVEYNSLTTANISNMAYGDQDCTLGPDSYCRSQYTYRQCKPGSLWKAWEDPVCYNKTKGKPVHEYVIY